jgi:hypothetical protein
MKKLLIAGAALLAAMFVMAATSSAARKSSQRCGNIPVKVVMPVGTSAFTTLVAINYPCSKAVAYVKASFTHPLKGVKPLAQGTVPGPAGFWCVVTADKNDHPMRGSCAKGPKNGLVSPTTPQFHWPISG